MYKVLRSYSRKSERKHDSTGQPPQHTAEYSHWQSSNGYGGGQRDGPFVTSPPPSVKNGNYLNKQSSSLNNSNAYQTIILKAALTPCDVALVNVNFIMMELILLSFARVANTKMAVLFIIPSAPNDLEAQLMQLLKVDSAIMILHSALVREVDMGDITTK